jgi:short-subunit dehydrogenase
MYFRIFFTIGRHRERLGAAEAQTSSIYAGGTDEKVRRPHPGAGTVARIGYRGLMRGQTVVIPGWRNRLIAFAVRLMPRRTMAGIARRLYETPRR